LDAQKLASKMLGAPAWATKLESLVKTQHAEAQTKMKSMETKMKSVEKTVKTANIQALMEKMVQTQHAEMQIHIILTLLCIIWAF
jgi:formate dehydrogenase maturation protein FdhE